MYLWQKYYGKCLCGYLCIKRSRSRNCCYHVFILYYINDFATFSYLFSVIQRNENKPIGRRHCFTIQEKYFFNFLQCSHKDSVFRISETTFLTHSEFINSCYIIWCAWQILSLTPAKAQRPTTTPYLWFFLLLFFEEIPRSAI